eukprot:CAMPEP_0202685918 /NCGR_PEP_ID=MMETSP1385-20130828/1734_1 /ASSEMBLY_ACC=CAM_ASM_000861 /TAXON_ID=933848 /ORGANISM="Elphidium margaritaceum" /LENGTH=370 /DNA_ID=CAMNT_0049340391 /DNA_START=58 /DNA_END=1170 /DNA_ORIENTATION=-
MQDKDSTSDCRNDTNEDPLADKVVFAQKYRALQDRWLYGSAQQENTEYGDHAYITQYVDCDGATNVDNDKIVFHPSYNFTYSEYEKSKVPLMTQENLDETTKHFKQHISRLERDIFRDLASKEATDADAVANGNNQEEKQKEESSPADLATAASAAAVDGANWIVPSLCIPIRADVRKFNFAKLAEAQKSLSGRLFDVIMMDPPWQLASANPTRGVALGYSQLGDDIISSLPVQVLQDNGLIFVWIINAKYRLALSLFKRWGYHIISDIAWVKQTVNRRIANGHGFYLQHAKETCLVGLKGDINKIHGLDRHQLKGMCSDVIYSERRGQSQKPTEVYQYIEKLVSNGFYMEIFGRRNNLRNGWLTVGNEL